MLRRLGENLRTMKLLILTGNSERASFRQRISVYLDILRSEGIEPTVRILEDSPFARRRQYADADRFDLVLLHKRCLNVLDGLFFRPRTTRVIFNYDDAVMLNDRGRSTPTHTARFRRSLRKADLVLVGSGYLADQARPYHPRVVVLPLGLRVEDYHADRPKNTDGKIRLVWIGSTPTLDYVRQLAPVIQTLTKRYPNLVLRLICDDFIDMEGVTVEKIPWTPQTRGLEIGPCDIGLAPLPDTPFTRGKCSFKVLEYSASGLPVVASPIGTNPEHVREGITGFLAGAPDEWIDRLSRLIEDPALRRQMGQNGLAAAREHDIALIGRKLCDLLRSLAARD